MICIKIQLPRWRLCWPPCDIFLAVSEKDIKFILFSKKPFFIFPQYVPMDMKHAVITTLLTRFRRKAAKNDSLKVKKWKKTDNWKNDLHKDPITSVNAVLTTTPMFSSQPPRMLQNLYFFRKNHFFPQYVPIDTKKRVITNSLKSFQRKSEKFFAPSTKNVNKTNNSEKWSA